MTHTAASLASLKLAEIKVIASELDIVPVGDKSKRETFITAILEFQSAQVIVQTPAIESQPIIEVPPVVQSTFDDEPQPVAMGKLIDISKHQSPMIVALVVILAVVMAVRAVVIVGVFGINLPARGATHASGMYRRWSERLPQPQPSMIPISA